MGGVEVCVGEYPGRRDCRRRCGESGFGTAGYFPDLAVFFIDSHSCIGPISQVSGGCWGVLAERAGRRRGGAGVDGSKRVLQESTSSSLCRESTSLDLINTS